MYGDGVGNVYYGIDIWEEAEKSWDLLRKTLKSSQYIEIKYEDLLDDVQKGLTIICDFLGVEYSGHMMDYAKKSSYDLPNKNCSYQWKTKYSKRELQLIEGKVSEMLLERGYELSGYPSMLPNRFEKFILMMKNKNFRIRYQIQKYGLRLFIKNILANKLGITLWRNECKHRINVIDINGLK